MAVFSLIEYGRKKADTESQEVIYSVIALSLIPLLYGMIDLLYGIRYNFGMPAYLIIMVIFIFVRSEWLHVKFLVKSAFITLLLFGFQWFDIIPKLTHYGFGRGEVSSDVKSIAEVIGATDALTFSAIIFFVIFFSNAVMILKIMSDQSKMLEAVETQKIMEVQLTEARIQGLKSRSYEEQQHLVHDLKSPLTSIQALVSISEMMVENEKVKDYMSRVSRSVDQLNTMISEILNENKQQIVEVDQLFSGILSQISAIEGSEFVHYSGRCQGLNLSVNRIRFSRMIINIVSNSLAAISDKKNETEDGIVNVYADKVDDYIIIQIKDTGSGIAPELMEQIWERGFSTKGSFGLGLSYIRSVVENHNGTIKMESEVGCGTNTILKFPVS